MMKCIPFTLGVAAGMAIAGTVVSAVYPDVARRMLRDSRRAVRSGRRMIGRMMP